MVKEKKNHFAKVYQHSEENDNYGAGNHCSASWIPHNTGVCELHKQREVLSQEAKRLQ